MSHVVEKVLDGWRVHQEGPSPSENNPNLFWAEREVDGRTERLTIGSQVTRGGYVSFFAHQARPTEYLWTLYLNGEVLGTSSSAQDIMNRARAWIRSHPGSVVPVT